MKPNFQLWPAVGRMASVHIPVALFFFTCVGLHAQKPSERHPFEIVPALEAPSNTTEFGSYDARTGYPVALYHLDDPTEGNTPELRAKYWLRLNALRLGLSDPNLADLQLKHVRNGQSGANVRFIQSHLGLPVHGAEVVVNLDPKGNVRFVSSSYATGLPDQLLPAKHDRKPGTCPGHQLDRAARSPPTRPQPTGGVGAWG
jgi:hypothetical protein